MNNGIKPLERIKYFIDVILELKELYPDDITAIKTYAGKLVYSNTTKGEFDAIKSKIESKGIAKFHESAYGLSWGEYSIKIENIDWEKLQNYRDELDQKLNPQLIDTAKTNHFESSINSRYDVVFSLAGEQKKLGHDIKNILNEKGLNCWIYTERESELVGVDMSIFLEDLFMNKSHNCVIIISKEYISKKWTGLERKYIISRWMNDNEYIIPIQYDISKLPGLPDIIGYIPLNNRSANELASIILDKVKNRKNEDTKTSIKQKVNFPLPRLTNTFNPFQEQDIWIDFIINELKDRIRKVNGMDLYSSSDSEIKKVRIFLKGEIIYSLNIYKNSISGEKGLSFFGTFGEIPFSANKATNAWGNFLWSKEKDDVVLELINASMLPTLGEQKQYTKEEFTNKLWKYLVDHLDNNY